jgi:small subunit ribosomal protein S1
MENGENMDTNEELKKYLESENVGTPEVGETRKCTVISSGTDFVVVDLLAKTEGIIGKKDLVRDPTSYRPGDLINAVVINYKGEEEGGRTYLSEKKFVIPNLLKELKTSMEEKKPVKGHITKKVRGGYSVEIEGALLAFLPGSQASALNNLSTSDMMNKEFDFEIINFEERNNGNNIVLSLDSLMGKKTEQFLEGIQVGQKISGTVKDITDFGIFVDVGQMTALLPKSEVSWERDQNLKNKFHPGDKIEAVVISKDPINKKMSISSKRLSEDPWEKVEEQYPIGTVIDAVVDSIKPYGILVRTGNGIKGLVRSSDIFWGNYKRNLKDYFQEDQNVRVEVTEIDKAKKRISFSIKDVNGDPWEGIEDRYHVDEVIDTKVEKILDNGVILGISEGVSGFAHISELSWNFVKRPGDLFKKNQNVKAQIIEISPETRRMKLSVKRLLDDIWADLSKNVKIGTPVECEIINIKNSGAIVRVANYNVEGFLPKSQFYDGIKPGDTFSAKIHKISYNPALDERDMVVTIKDENAEVPNRKKENHEPHEIHEENFTAQGPMRTTIGDMVNKKREE